MKENKITEEDVKLLSGVIAHETNLVYLLARCIDTMIADIEQRMWRVNHTFRIKQDVKKRLKDYIHNVETTSAQFRHFVEPAIMESVDDDWKQYERTREYANELIRLVMLYYETCTKSNEKHTKVFDMMSSLLDENCLGVFTVEDINRYDLGCKKHDRGAED